MFGLFGKSFTSEMAEIDSEAKKLGGPMLMAMHQQDFIATQKFLEQINELTKRRIDCCKKSAIRFYGSGTGSRMRNSSC